MASSFNPVSKIHSLLNSLDQELMQLCQQCTVPKPVSSQNGSAFGSSSMATTRHISAKLSTSPRIITTLAPPTHTSDVHKRQLRNAYRTRVIDAYRNRRIFTVYGNYHTIRRSLLHRGWLEKLPPNRFSKLQALSEETLLEHARRGNDYEAVIISKMINHFPAFFIWQSKSQRDINGEVLPYRNRVRRSHSVDFSTKVGLVGCVEQERWFHEDGVSGMRYPRFYRLGSNFEDRVAFIEDYQCTQALSLLRYIREHDVKGLIDLENGSVNTTVLDFALANVKKMMKEREHHSLDDSNTKQQTPAELVENQAFMVNSTEILTGKAKIKTTENILKEYINLATKYLDEIERIRPDYKWDGYRNLWILKPGFQSRGIGIVIRSSLDEILQWSSNNMNRKYIVQKYIERPLLIYKTKFDIRQYMLLTIGEAKISIWLYRDCYLRFSSQEFSLDDLRESIHLTNNSVQKRYKNNQARDVRLPKQNMWSLDQFKCYLKHINALNNTWSKIFNGFKQNLVAVVLSSIDETNLVQNAFELYGCDFMLDEQFNPILIEINSTPDLSPSTEVTARICPMVLKDVLRVIIDLPQNPLASTGLFERVYEINYQLKHRIKETESLELIGKAMTLHKPRKQQNRITYFKNLMYPMKAVNKTPAIESKSTPATTTNSPRRETGKQSRKLSVKKRFKEHIKFNTTVKLETKAKTNSNILNTKLDSLTKQNLASQYTKIR